MLSSKPWRPLIILNSEPTVSKELLEVVTLTNVVDVQKANKFGIRVLFFSFFSFLLSTMLKDNSLLWTKMKMLKNCFHWHPLREKEDRLVDGRLWDFLSVSVTAQSSFSHPEEVESLTSSVTSVVGSPKHLAILRTWCSLSKQALQSFVTSWTCHGSLVTEDGHHLAGWQLSCQQLPGKSSTVHLSC